MEEQKLEQPQETPKQEEPLDCALVLMSRFRDLLMFWHVQHNGGQLDAQCVKYIEDEMRSAHVAIRATSAAEKSASLQGRIEEK